MDRPPLIDPPATVTWPSKVTILWHSSRTKMTKLRPLFFTPLLVLACIAVPMNAAAPAGDADVQRGFTETVQPFLATYCASCHSGEKAAAQLDLRQYSSPDAVVQDFTRWNRVLARLTAGEMPPKNMKQPSAAERQQVIEWIQGTWANEARKRDGDPGVVLARRLSNAEYDYTIRDLTGVDIHPAREFPVDPANQAGFDNSGESLAMSPALLNKYLLAARDVADHMFLNAERIRVRAASDAGGNGPRPVLHPADRRFLRSSEHRLRGLFPRRMDLQAPRHPRQAEATLADVAAQTKVSAKYLTTIWQTLEQTKEDIGPLAKLQTMWRALPVPKSNQPDLANDATANDARLRGPDAQGHVAEIRQPSGEGSERHLAAADELEERASTPRTAAISIVPRCALKESRCRPRRSCRRVGAALLRGIRQIKPWSHVVPGPGRAPHLPISQLSPRRRYPRPRYPRPQPLPPEDAGAVARQLDPAAAAAAAEAAAADMTKLRADVAAYTSRMENADLVVPAGQRARYEAAFAKFASVFPGRVLRARAWPLLSRRFGRQGPSAERRLPQRDGLHARRHAAQRADSGRQGPEGAGSAVGSVRVRRGLHRPHVRAVLLQPERRGAGQRPRVGHAPAVGQGIDGRIGHHGFQEGLSWRRPPRRRQNNPVAMRGDRGSLRPRERHRFAASKRRGSTPSRATWTR